MAERAAGAPAAAGDSPALELVGLVRRYGERAALDDVSFTLDAGRPLVVFGPNGAGKSTLLRVLATLLRPHAGTVEVLGEPLPARGWAVRGRVGLLSHEPLLYRDLSPRDNLRFHARLHGVGPDRVEEVLDAVQLGLRADDPLHTFSRGMVQRAAVARAVLHDPALLLLDEPRANLDPAAAELVEPLIGAASGRTWEVTTRVRAGRSRRRPRARRRTGRPAGAGRRRRPRGDRGAVPMSTVLALLRKELLLERKVPQLVPAMALFSVTTFVVFHFALQQREVSGDLAAGILVVTLLFATMLGLNRLYVADKEEGGFDAFLLAPVDRTALGIAKAVALFAFLVLVELVMLPAFAVLLLGPGMGWEVVGKLVVVLVMVDVGLAVVGTLVGALAVQTRARDLIGPLIALPLLVPVVISAARALAPVLAAAGPGALQGRYLGLLGLYDLVFGLLAYAVFDFLLED